MLARCRCGAGHSQAGSGLSYRGIGRSGRCLAHGRTTLPAAPPTNPQCSKPKCATIRRWPPTHFRQTLNSAGA